VNLGTLGKKISSVTTKCEVYLDKVSGLPNYKLFPLCDSSKYDTVGGIIVDVNGTIPANSTIILRLLGLRV